MIEKIGKDVNRKKVRNEKYFELEKERMKKEKRVEKRRKQTAKTEKNIVNKV